MKGTWRIILTVDGDRWRVSHVKREQSASFEPGEYFEFEWELMLTFDPDFRTFTR